MPSALFYVMTKWTSKFFFTKSYGFILEQTHELGFRELKTQDSGADNFIIFLCAKNKHVNDFGHEEPFEAGNHL